MARPSFRLPGAANDLNLQGFSLRNANFNWNNNINYGVGDPAVRNGRWYISLVDNNDNNDPATSATQWRLLGDTAIDIPPHSSTDTYAIGEVVRDGRRLYWADQAVPAGTPLTNTSFWNRIAEFEDVPQPYDRANNTDGYLRDSDVTINGNSITKTDGTGFTISINSDGDLVLPDGTIFPLRMTADQLNVPNDLELSGDELELRRGTTNISTVDLGTLLDPIRSSINTETVNRQQADALRNIRDIVDNGDDTYTVSKITGTDLTIEAGGSVDVTFYWYADTISGNTVTLSNGDGTVGPNSRFRAQSTEPLGSTGLSAPTNPIFYSPIADRVSGGGTGTGLPPRERAVNLVEQGWGRRTLSRNARGLSISSELTTPDGTVNVSIVRDSRGLTETRTYTGTPITNILGANHELVYTVVSRDARGLKMEDTWASVEGVGPFSFSITSGAGFITISSVNVVGDDTERNADGSYDIPAATFERQNDGSFRYTGSNVNG